MDSLRLIETWDVLKSRAMVRELDENFCLIETWDVLKLPWTRPTATLNTSLIETWDVLKFDRVYKTTKSSVFNRNMGCIEMHINRAQKHNRNV